jgi:membrane-associated phospholipid phosphatase
MTETPISPGYLPYTLFALVWAVSWLVLLPLRDVWGALRRLAQRVAPRLMAWPRFGRVWERGRARIGSARAYLPIIAILILGIGATLVIGEDFVELAVLLRQNSPAVLGVDQTVYTWAASMRSDSATRFFVAFTLLGTPVGMGVITAKAAAALYLRKHRGFAVYLAATAIGGGLLNLALKGMFERARPDLAAALRKAHGYSFPSGHAMGSMMALGAIAYVLSRSKGSWRVRSATIALLVSTVLAIGVSRVYLGVHWISDIIAGFAAGFMWLVIATVAFEAFWRIRHIRGGEYTP